MDITETPANNTEMGSFADSPWDDNPSPASVQESEWAKMSSEFTNAGYREGITAGKEAALQEGFDDGFANIGAPLGRELGLLRGTASALLSLLTSSVLADAALPRSRDQLLSELRGLISQLSQFRLSDVAPRDEQAEAHVREHMESDLPVGESEKLQTNRDMEGIEDMLASIPIAGAEKDGRHQRPSSSDLNNLKDQLSHLSKELGLQL